MRDLTVPVDTARFLRRHFADQDVKESRRAALTHEVAGEEIFVAGFGHQRNLYLFIVSDGTAVRYPLTRKLLKFLKAEFEKETQYIKRLNGGESRASMARAGGL